MQYPTDYFKHNLNEYTDRNKLIKNKIRSTSILRIIVFATTILAVYLTTHINTLSVLICFLSVWLYLSSWLTGI